MDGDVAGGRTGPERDVPLIRSGLGRRLEADPDVSGNGAQVDPGSQVVCHPDRKEPEAERKSTEPLVVETPISPEPELACRSPPSDELPHPRSRTSR